MLKYKIQGFIIGALIMLGTQAIAGTKWQEAVITDHYHDVVIIQPYYVEVCGEQTQMAGDVIDGAVWGAIFGAILGDVIDDKNGRLPGAIIGGAIGAKTEENKVGGTSIVCRTEQRKTKSSQREYSHSTVGFRNDGKWYEL